MKKSKLIATLLLDSIKALIKFLIKAFILNRNQCFLGKGTLRELRRYGLNICLPCLILVGGYVADMIELIETVDGQTDVIFFDNSGKGTFLPSN